MAKKCSMMIKIMFMMLIMSGISFSEEVAKVIKKPEGIMAFVVVIPLIIIVFMLYKKFDMLVAGFVGGILAMIIGKISLGDANGILLKSIPAMLTITVPIINSALAMAVFKSGGYTSALSLVKRGIRGKVEYLAAFIVILQAAATYMSGIGGGSAMVIAPLAFAALGAIPELIAAMSIAAAVCFTTSPASLESSIVSKLSNTPVAEYVSIMKIFALVFTILAIALAYYGAKKRKVIFSEDHEDEYAGKTNKELFIMTIPTIFLLSAVIFGPFVNKLVGMPLISPLVYSIITIALIAICTKLTLGESSSSMVEGSNYILVRLFSVGIFLTFINIIGETGAFSAIVSVAEIAPKSLVVPVAVLAGFLVGVPAGAYVGSILMLVIPIAVSLGFSPMELGFVAIGVGLGSQMSFVNITMQALSSGFRIPILDVVKGNSKWILGSLGILLVISYFV
ncbi:MAG: citrate transporter [Sebaldella sp.]|nr:citrate transporter [Sebaldella sp.]